MKILPLILSLIVTISLLNGCSEAGKNQASNDVSSNPSTSALDNLPPGFTDDAPPPPTSSTQVLSGGTFENSGDVVLADAVIVLTEGNFIAAGARGNTDMPNDSIGHDMRGKFIVPGHVTDGQIVFAESLTEGDVASLLILDQSVAHKDAKVLGYFKDGELTMLDASE